MSALRDRQVRAYCRFLLVFTVLLAAAALGLCAAYARAAADLYLAHDQAVASALLAQGVPQATVAAALTGMQASPAGQALVETLGLERAAASGLLPLLARFQRGAALAAGGGALGLVLLLWSGAALFLHRRETLCQQAGDVLARYLRGDYTRRLPQNEEGALFGLFAAVEQLATMLQSRTEAERQSKDFLKRTLSDISHQLKTPLAALVLYQELLVQEAGDPAAVRGCAAKSEAALRRMEQLIQVLLKLARLDAGSIVFDRRPCLMDALAARALSELTVRAEAEGKTLAAEGAPALRLTCDLEWTAEALGNLVKNALDHTGPGGVIRVAWEQRPGLVCITVTDNGSGIAPEDIHHIFKRFYRSRQAAGTVGVGLGLSLARSIAEGQGGSISVQSEPGEGAVFTLAFPQDGPAQS